ncbi:MAG: DUF559 domain-containing protein [Micromonosporaceae bacterium]
MTERHGLFTRTDARECGFSDDQIRRRLAGGDWRRVLGRVYAPAALPSTARLRDVAAQLAIPGAVLSGPSAARWYGFGLPDVRVCVTVGRHQRTRVAGVRLLREPLARTDVRLVDGVLVTSRERAVFDCLRLLPEPAARDLLDRALLLTWTTMPDLTGRVRAHVGRHGAPRLVRLVHEASGGARSAAERRFLSLLRRAGVTGWRPNYRVMVDGRLIAVVDVAFPSWRLAIEIDGWAYHQMPERFRNDRIRQNRLVAAGWTVLRFTWADLTEHPHQVLRTITALLGRRPA